MRRLALVALLALAVAGPAAADLPTHPSGTVVGEGEPLKAYASLVPVVHLFGDVVTAKLAVVADTKWVDPLRLRVRTDFSPYSSQKPPRVLRLHVGRFEQVTWIWTLRCLGPSCVPREPPSDAYHIFRFAPARVDYVSGHGGKRLYGIVAQWPRVEAISQMTPGLVHFLQLTKHINWQFHLAPVASPTYRVSPSLVFWLALALAALAGCGALGLTARWIVRTHVRPAASAAVPGTVLERALAVLRYAHEQGDETLQRKAFERVAAELGVARAGELRDTARELAWSPRTPEDEEIEVFAVRALDSEEDA